MKLDKQTKRELESLEDQIEDQIEKEENRKMATAKKTASKKAAKKTVKKTAAKKATKKATAKKVTTKKASKRGPSIRSAIHDLFASKGVEKVELNDFLAAVKKVKPDWKGLKDDKMAKSHFNWYKGDFKKNG